MKIVDLAQVFFGVGAMIGDGGIDLTNVRPVRNVGIKAPRAVSLDGYLAGAFRQFGRSVQRVFNISDASVAIIRLIKTKPVLPVSLRRDAEINARLLTPE